MARLYWISSSGGFPDIEAGVCAGSFRQFRPAAGAFRCTKTAIAGELHAVIAHLADGWITPEKSSLSCSRTV
jgi:hypothetical protein